MNKSKLLKKSIIYYENKHYNVEIYKKCPYCNDILTPRFEQSTRLIFKDDEIVFISRFHHECCNKKVFVTHLKSSDKLTLLYSYPPISPTPLPDSIALISERAAKLYQQAERAYQINDFELAAIGYRSFVEILAKDFLIKEQNKNEKDVKKLKLNNCLTILDNNLLVSGDVIRYIGNDKTHYEQKLSHIPIDTLKYYLNIFITSIDNMYAIKHPPVELSRNQRN